MFWKFLGLQKMLDGLFDEGWCCLGVPEASATELHSAGDLIAG